MRLLLALGGLLGTDLDAMVFKSPRCKNRG